MKTQRPIQGANSASLPSPDQIDFPDDTHAISARAYALWQENGSTHGRDREHWLRAEQEVRAARRLQMTDDESDDSPRVRPPSDELADL